MKYFNAILDGIWVVSFDCIVDLNILGISDSLRNGYWISEDSYEIQGDEKCTNNVPEIARTSKLDKKPGLFHKFMIYLYGEFHTPSHEELVQLIEKGDGVVLQNLDELKDKRGKKNVYVVCDVAIQNSFEIGASILKKFKPLLASEWILDSISNFAIQEINHYVAF